ncbi:hypothetical protein VTJ49DRAFT_444 [Mycothermus thermophilus]|uniref:FAS1 domain-containing protein n=1 Tax=Humicola insolens TaxID=85995 RepID=A0ABR3VF64_HUMIN
MVHKLHAALAVLSAVAVSPAAVSAASLDSVLAGQANVTTFREILKKHSDIYGSLPKGVTVVAPNDNAFLKLGDWDKWEEDRLKATLNYHILKNQVKMSPLDKGDSTWESTLLTDEKFTTVTDGQRLILTKQPGGEVVFTSGFANRGTIVAEDLSFDNGLVQIIDSAMRMPEDIESTARNAYTDLTSFVGALYATGLMSELAKLKDVTIFAPRNAAFQQLAGTLEGMDRELLKRVLRYHIVPGQVSHAWELKSGSELPSADNGNKVTITRHTNFIFANSAEIIQSDILISNGVVHLIDNVLNPDKAGARPNTSAMTTAQPPVFTVTGASATGNTVPTPFATDLPCTEACPQTTAGSNSQAASGAGGNDNAGVAGARPELAGMVVALGMAFGAMHIHHHHDNLATSQKISSLKPRGDNMAPLNLFRRVRLARRDHRRQPAARQDAELFKLFSRVMTALAVYLFFFVVAGGLGRATAAPTPTSIPGPVAVPLAVPVAAPVAFLAGGPVVVPVAVPVAVPVVVPAVAPAPDW